MSVRMSSLITGLLICLLLLSFVSVLNAADNTRFTLKNVVIYDSKLGLEWVPFKGQNMNHYQAEKYVKNLSLAGGGWRLPTREELKSLYDNTKPGNIDPIFNIDGTWVWTSELANASNAWILYFNDGDEYDYARDGSSGNYRVLAVRSRR